MLDVDTVPLKAILSLYLLPDLLILLLVLFSLLDQSVNLFLRKSALVVGNRNFLRPRSALISGMDTHDTIGINVE